MKFFPELASCWSGALVIPAAGDGRQTEERARYSGHTTKSKRVVAAKVKHNNWKPKLNAISEDRPMAEVNRRSGGVDDEKRTVKVKPKATVKDRSPPIHEVDYWKSAHTMALPAFAPTSFLF